MTYETDQAPAGPASSERKTPLAWLERVNAGTMVISFAVVFLCVPGILLEREPGWNEWPFNRIQFYAAFVCFPATCVFLVVGKCRGRAGWASGGLVRLAWVALCVTGLFWAFCVSVIVLFSLGGAPI